MGSKYNLSDSEYDIMEYIWQKNEPLMFREIAAYCNDVLQRSWKKQTIQTLLTRLAEKGALQINYQGHLKNYAPSMTKEKYIQQWTHSFLQDSFDGSLRSFLTAFTGGESLSQKDLQELQEFLEDKDS